MKIKIKLIRDIPVPERAYKGDSAVDLINAGPEKELKPGERMLLPTGIAIAVPEGYELQIRSRSGLAINHGITVLNSPATIDSGFRGEIKVILYNSSNLSFKIENNMRIAQAALCPVIHIEWQLAEELEKSERSDSGFGSSGI